MELRTLVLILISAGLPYLRGAGPILRYPLDERAVYTVKIGPDAPTTVMFPGPIGAVDAAGISGKAEDRPPVLISHEEGTHFFSVRALRPDSTGAANVVFRDRVYAFAFITSDTPDRTVTFHDDAGAASKSVSARSGTSRLLALLDLANHYAAIAAQYPALVQRIERTQPGTTNPDGAVVTVIEEILRFEDEDALVFRVRLENRGKTVVRYAPAQLGVKVSGTILPVALTDAPGAVPAGHSSVIMLVVLGKSDGSAGGVSLKNIFSVVIPVVTSAE